MQTEVWHRPKPLAAGLAGAGDNRCPCQSRGREPESEGAAGAEGRPRAIGAEGGGAAQHATTTPYARGLTPGVPGGLSDTEVQLVGQLTTLSTRLQLGEQPLPA